MKTYRPLSLFVAVALLAATLSAADPAEGKWLGTLGVDPVKSEFGLDVRAKADGQLDVLLYLEQMHYDGIPAGALKKSDGRYQLAVLGLDFTVEGDAVKGVAGPNKRPFELKRVAGLPRDPFIPAGLPAGPGPKWQRKLSGAIWARATVHDGVAYVGTGGGVMHAVRVSDGTFVWSVAAGRGVHGAACVTDDAVYFACDNGFLFRLNRADGKEVWRYDLGDARVPRVLPSANIFDYDHSGPAPVLADGVLYIGAADGGFHAVNAADGSQVWRIQADGKIRGTAAVSGPNIIFATLKGPVHMVERATGREVWKQEGKTPVTSSPVVMGDKVISGTRGSVLRALRLDTGAELWRQTYWGSWVESTPVLGDNGLGYVGTSDYRRVTCFDPADGRVVWRTDIFGWCWNQPVLTARHVYVSAGGTIPYDIRHEGGLTALDRATGKIAWRWPMPNPPGAMHWGFAAGPVLAGDTLIVGGLDGTLYAFPVE